MEKNALLRNAILSSGLQINKKTDAHRRVVHESHRRGEAVIKLSFGCQDLLRALMLDTTSVLFHGSRKRICMQEIMYADYENQVFSQLLCFFKKEATRNFAIHSNLSVKIKYERYTLEMSRGIET